MRTRTERRERLVPHTIDGETKMVTEEYTVDVPAPPRDWDHIVLTSALAIVAVFLLIVIVWSTTSIGALLDRTVSEPTIAYAAATGFSAGWIICMAFEWLNRYDPDRIRRPRTAGHVFLVADMTAVCIHGWVADSFKVGVIGAALSGGAKWLWTIALDHQAAPLDSRTQQWVTIKRGEIGGRLALGSVRRQLARAESRAAAEEAALRPALVQEQPDEQDTAPAVSRTTRSAVLAAHATLPDATPEDIVTALFDLGVDTDKDTVSRVLDTQDSRSEHRVLRLTPPGQSVADTIRTALSSGVQDKDKLDAYAARLHPDVPRATIVRTRNRVLGEKRPA